MKELFQEDDWAFILKEQDMSVELDDQDIVGTLNALKGAETSEAIMEILHQRHSRLGKAYRMGYDYNLKWLFDSVSKWYVVQVLNFQCVRVRVCFCLWPFYLTFLSTFGHFRIDIYTMPFSVFNSDATLEYFWRSQVWGVLDTLFYDIPNTLMIGGESQGLESVERRNQQQAKNGRKASGSKADGYLRSFGSTKSDWLTIEGARNWDPFAKKYKTEAYWKLARQMHDIFRARTSDRDSSTLQNFRTYGLIFGGNPINTKGASAMFSNYRVRVSNLHITFISM